MCGGISKHSFHLFRPLVVLSILLSALNMSLMLKLTEWALLQPLEELALPFRVKSGVAYPQVERGPPSV